MPKHRVTSRSEFEKELALLANLMKRMPKGRRRVAAIRVCCEACFNSLDYFSDWLGVLEASKMELTQINYEMEHCDIDDDDSSQTGDE